MITKEEVARALPPNLKGMATQAFADQINNVTTDPILAEQIRNNFVSYTGVLKDGKYKTEDYLHAVVYVGYKLMGASNIDAYCKTFPARHARLVANGIPTKDIAAHVSAYNRGKLVNAILEQSLVPTWVLNQDMHQKALNNQFEIMNDTNVSPKVRVEAANSILTHLSKPKEMGPLINFDMRENKAIDELRTALSNLATGQVQAIKDGTAGIKTVLDQNIVEAEVKVV